MNQDERRTFLIEALLDERPGLRGAAPPIAGEEAERRFLRALMNTREPGPLPPEALAVHDAYLRGRIAEQGVTDFFATAEMRPHVRAWRGDITTLSCDAIVNAANSGMTGCWVPNHHCVDNAIHTFAGVGLREECARMMEAQGRPEPVGLAKATGAYNLPCSRIIHTVGPRVEGRPTDEERAHLASCYRSCYRIAAAEGIASLAFCCVSTGLFGFPQEEAARIAVATIAEEQAGPAEPVDVCFVVFTDRDERIYHELLS